MTATRLTTALTVIALALGLGELADAFSVAVPAFAVLFGAVFLTGGWLLRRGSAAAGAAVVGMLSLVEVLEFFRWPKETAADWVVDTTFLVVSAAGVLVAVALTVSRRSRGAGVTSPA